MTEQQMLIRERLRDALDNQNVRAFLRAIRLGEGTSDALGYRRLVGGGEFDSFDQHPERKVFIPKYGVWSSAAGAFQIIRPVWANLVKRCGFVDFSPGSQDEAAVSLINEKGALPDLYAGHVEAAIEKCAPIWASLPGSKAGQRTERLDRVIAEYRRHHGTVAGEAA